MNITANDSIAPTTFLPEQNTYINKDDHAAFYFNLIDRYLKTNPYQETETFIKLATIAAFNLPESLKHWLLDFKLNGNQQGYLLLRGLPIDQPLMPTPTDLHTVKQQKHTFYSEFWLSTIGSFFGEPFSYVQENEGNLFHNVRPTSSKQDKLSSESSSILLDFHTETAFHPHAPDYLILFCLRGCRDHQAKTIVTSIGNFYPAIDKPLATTLRKPWFKTGIDYSFGSENGMRGNGPTIPILYGDPNDPLIIFDPDLMLGINQEAELAITQLRKIINDYQQGVVLEPGDLIMIDNKRALHGRTYFKAYFDGYDRWLQRLYISRDLRSANILFGKRERIISYDFSDD